MMCPPMTAMPAGRHATVALAPGAAGELSTALDAFCAAEGVPEETAWRLKVAMDEIVANIVSHGAAASRGASIDVWLRRDGDHIEMRIADDGVPFDPLSCPAPDVTAPLDSRRPGGLGVALVRGLMDEVQYERTGRNILIVRKRLENGTHPGGGTR